MAAASAKGTLSQLERLWMKTESVTPSFLLDGSLVPVTSANVPLVLRDLSHLMPIVVLVPRTTIDERGSPQQTLRNTWAVQIEHSNSNPSRPQAPIVRFQST